MFSPSLTQVVQGIEPASHTEAPGEPTTISNLAADGNDHNVFHRGSDDPLSEKCQQVNPAEDVGRFTDNPLLQPETPAGGSVIDLSVMGDTGELSKDASAHHTEGQESNTQVQWRSERSDVQMVHPATTSFIPCISNWMVDNRYRLSHCVIRSTAGKVVRWRQQLPTTLEVDLD